MKIAVFFDGVGLSRLGLEQAGHDCTGFELDPLKHHLSIMLGSGKCVLADVRDVDLTDFDAVWASPPCQGWSRARMGQAFKPNPYNDMTLLDWSMSLQKIYPHLKYLWVENVYSHGRENTWGCVYNAAQFLEAPRQNRVRVIGGSYVQPKLYRDFQHRYPKLDICPAITASLWNDYKRSYPEEVSSLYRRKEVCYYGRIPTVREAAWHQGLDEVPETWFMPPPNFTWARWRSQLYEGIGNGVPVFMSRAFGEALNEA